MVASVFEYYHYYYYYYYYYYYVTSALMARKQQQPADFYNGKQCYMAPVYIILYNSTEIYEWIILLTVRAEPIIWVYY